MSKWTLSFLPEAVNDLKKLDKGVRNRVAKTIERVLENSPTMRAAMVSRWRTRVTLNLRDCAKSN